MPRVSARAEQNAGAVQSSSSAVCEIVCIDAQKVASSRKHALHSDTVQFIADTFRLLGDPTRVRILTALARHELCVCDLALVVGISQSAVSHSLRALRQMRVVRFRKNGKIAYYSLADGHIGQLLNMAVEHAEEQ